MDGVLFHACSLDGLWLIHDNYPSSIPVFYNVLDTVRIFIGYDKINSVRSDFLEYPIQYKKVGYCWGNCHESTIIVMGASYIHYNPLSFSGQRPLSD